MTSPTHRALRLTIDTEALKQNWRWLQAQAGTACGAAIKADGYGVGAREAMSALADAGCRDFFVSTWAEAKEHGAVPEGLSLAVLHGAGPDDVGAAIDSTARPVLNSAAQVERWKQVAPDRPCDVMIDTGMNRLGLRTDEIGCLGGLSVVTLHSHLACADEDHSLNGTQLSRFRELRSAISASRYSLANSAGICLGRDFAFDLVRPGLALYGGIPRGEARGHIRQVVRVEAQVVQRRTIRAGESCGYGAVFIAQQDTEAAILNIGYADGYLRTFASTGRALAAGAVLPVLGRISMDLIAVNCGSAADLSEGDWAEIDYDLPTAAAASELSQYELLTALGRRFDRRWV